MGMSFVIGVGAVWLVASVPVRAPVFPSGAPSWMETQDRQRSDNGALGAALTASAAGGLAVLITARGAARFATSERRVFFSPWLRSGTAGFVFRATF